MNRANHIANYLLEGAEADWNPEEVMERPFDPADFGFEPREENRWVYKPSYSYFLSLTKLTKFTNHKIGVTSYTASLVALAGYCRNIGTLYFAADVLEAELRTIMKDFNEATLDIDAFYYDQAWDAFQENLKRDNVGWLHVAYHG